MGTIRKLLRNRRVIAGTGLVSVTVGIITYHAYLIDKYLSALVNTRVLDSGRRSQYIYINYSIYRESQKEIKRKQEENKYFVNIISNPFIKWWKSMKHSLGWRLLRMAQTGNHDERLKAIHQLSLLDHLRSGDLYSIAQVCDSRSAIALARSDCDPRWFPPPKRFGVVTNPKLLLKQIHDLLAEVKSNKCAAKLLNKTFGNFKFKEFDPKESLYVKRCNQKTEQIISKSDEAILKQCVDVLLHLTEYEEVAEKIILAGGLVQMMELHKIFNFSMEYKLKICKIIANLSLCQHRAQDFFVTGWVSVLAKWARDIDIRINVTANKALSNLDKDANEDNLYKSKIYPLYPRKRVTVRPQLDIVFVHGILGGVFMTWRQREDRFEEVRAKWREKQKEIQSSGEYHCEHPIDGDSQPVEGDWRDGSPVQPESVIPMMKRAKHSNRNMIFDNPVAQDLIESINNARLVNKDWDVVYADCPEYASDDAPGPFAVSGDLWEPHDEDASAEQYTNCWAMDWLEERFPEIRVIGLNYYSTLTQWYSKYLACGCKIDQATIESRAKEFLDDLAAAGVGADGRPVVFVGHSMGGLIVKSILNQAMDSDRLREKRVAENTRAIMFLGTPHKGTAIAKLKQHTQFLLSPSLEVREMVENGAVLLELHKRFLDTITKIKNRLEFVSVAEGVPTLLTPFKLAYDVVTEESARIGLGDFYRLPYDHLDISKPDSKQSFIYQRLVKLIKRSLDDFKEEQAKLEDLKRKTLSVELWNGIVDTTRFW